MNKRTQRQPDGFTLVEVLVAGVILALSAAVLGMTISQSMRSLALARDYQEAAELLDKTLTKIDLIGPSNLLNEVPSENMFEPPHDRFAWKVQIEPYAQGHLYEVTVHILWKTPGGTTRSIEAQTLLNDPPDSRPTELDWDSI